MKCIRCERPLTNPAKVVDTALGPQGWGRVCAVKAGLLNPKLRGIFSPAIKQPETDPRQMSLDLTR